MILINGQEFRREQTLDLRRNTFRTWSEILTWNWGERRFQFENQTLTSANEYFADDFNMCLIFTCFVHGVVMLDLSFVPKNQPFAATSVQIYLCITTN